MRRVLGWLVLLFGVLLVAGGTTVAVFLGPDDRASTGPHRLTSAGYAILTAPDAFQYGGVDVELDVEPQGRGQAPDVFLGLAHVVDAEDYLGGSPHTRIDTVSIPWDLTTTQVEGERSVTTAPDDLDWWLTRDLGDDPVVDFPLDDEPVTAVLMNVDATPGVQADLRASLVRPGGFVGGIAVAVIGVGVTGLSRIRLVRGDSRPGRRRTGRLSRRGDRSPNSHESRRSG